MPSTFTTSGVELIADGEQSGLWGATTNVNLQIIDRMTSQAGTITLSGTTHTLTVSNGVLSDGQYGVLVFSGSPSGTNTVTVNPNTAQRTFFVRNTTAQSVVLTQGSGGNVTVPSNTSKVVYTNGAGAGAAVFDITNTVAANVTGNAGTATALQTARTFTIGSTGKTFNGTANVSWTLAEIGVNNATLTLATSGIATGSQTFTANQGTNATFTVNVPATDLSVTGGTTAGPTINSSTGTNVTIPTASGTASGVVTTNAQTFAGVKTFSSTITGSVSGNAGTATTLQTARTIGGVSFDGSANINLPGVNQAGNQNTTGSAASLTTARTINGVSFNGTANITLPTVNDSGDQTVAGIKTFSAALRVPQNNNSSGGGIDFQGQGGTFIRGTVQDGASSTAANLQLQSWQGIGFGPSISGQAVPIGENAVWFNVRNGDIGGRGALTMSGNITAFSDVRLKTDLQVIPDALAKVQALTGYTYTRKDTGERQTGVVAQDVQGVLPEAVNDSGEHLAVAYGNMVGLLIEAIKELTDRVKELEAR